MQFFWDNDLEWTIDNNIYDIQKPILTIDYHKKHR